jgi:hypothetical protein
MTLPLVTASLSLGRLGEDDGEVGGNMKAG